MHTINCADRQMRKNMAEHVRETIRRGRGKPVVRAPWQPGCFVPQAALYCQ